LLELNPVPPLLATPVRLSHENHNLGAGAFIIKRVEWVEVSASEVGWMFLHTTLKSHPIFDLSQPVGRIRFRGLNDSKKFREPFVSLEAQ
jgi:hypothetical protein